MDITESLTNARVVPVLTLFDSSLAIPLAECLLQAGIGVVEITLRTDAALMCIEEMARAVPELTVGAGSIRRPEQFKNVFDAGAQFAVSPGATDSLLEASQLINLPFIPGATTASEMLKLLEGGYSLQKFFPAELNGGLKALKAISAPIPELQFFPTGGIDAKLAAEYLRFKAVICVGGSWFVPPAMLDAKDFDTIGELARKAVLALQPS